MEKKNNDFLVICVMQLTSCTEQIVQLMQERDILQDANNQMNEVSARKLQVSTNFKKIYFLTE